MLEVKELIFDVRLDFFKSYSSESFVEFFKLHLPSLTSYSSTHCLHSSGPSQVKQETGQSICNYI
jgi:hypothetical protein